MSGECKELQDEEREALASIYEGDDMFKQINPTTFQYKVGVWKGPRQRSLLTPFPFSTEKTATRKLSS